MKKKNDGMLGIDIAMILIPMFRSCESWTILPERYLIDYWRYFCSVLWKWFSWFSSSCSLL